MWFFNYFKSSKNEIIPPNTMHPEMVKIIRWQFEQYCLNK